MLSIIQRTKVQLIELRPTMSDEANQKLQVCSINSFRGKQRKENFLLQKIDDDLTINFELFEQALAEYKREYGNTSDDLDKMIARVVEDMAEVRARLHEKGSELNAYNVVREEYESTIENILKIIELSETRIKQTHGIDLRQNLDSLKV